MQRRKVDNRIRVLIENGVAERQRGLFVVVGDRGKDQVVILHHMLSKATVKARPSVLWCYKKELGFSSHRKKRMRQLQKKIKSGTLNIKDDDPFELFIAATNIRYCYYNETHKILGNTFGMCVLQDFEALTPNLLARTVETVEGGGIVVILLRTMNSLKQLYTMTMDVHSRYRTEAHQDVVGRFNERFILSLASCKNCIVIDDQLNILPISSHVANITPVPPQNSSELKSVKDLKKRKLAFHEHLDYEIIQSLNPEFNKAVVRVNVFKEHRQTIQYIHPADSVKLGQAELVVIDEAAAIPLPLVKKLLGPYLVFMASTINGYEGTGRSLSLKLIQQLRQQSAQAQVTMTAENKSTATAKLASARTLHEVSLHESIRYAPGDPVEKWLNDLLCLDCLSITRIISGCPLPEACDLYYVNRDTLFCYHRASEVFLQRLMALYVASHYKNSPNDLQMLSDAPAHHLFCLLPPVPPTQNSLPEVLAVVQVCMEGEISRQSIMNSLSRGKKASGDLIPWTVSEQFQDPDFGALSGGRIVRIAVHPDYQGMGYGSRALNLLQMYYEGKFPCLEEKPIQKPKEIATVSSETVSLLEEVVTPRKDLPPLLLKLSERQAESLDYLGVSYGLTPRLLKFWKRAGFVPVYLRQTPNDLTGEHSCIMMKMLNEEDVEQEPWLTAFWKDFRRRFLSLLSYQFSTFSPSLALNILQNKNIKQQSQPPISRAELESAFIPYDLKRLEMYSRNMVDYHLIMDMVPTIARMFFLNQLGDISLSAAQSVCFTTRTSHISPLLSLSCCLLILENRFLFVSLTKEVQESILNTIEYRYIIRGDDEEWNEVLSKAGQNASIVSVKRLGKLKYHGEVSLVFPAGLSAVNSTHSTSLSCCCASF
uniref:RNA cytidine acetyltransferase n=1 Tax=Pavo cristatus TaxID=9049 RepID=A0A8C9EK63_PAVCR